MIVRITSVRVVDIPVTRYYWDWDWDCYVADLGCDWQVPLGNLMDAGAVVEEIPPDELSGVDWWRLSLNAESFGLE